MFRLLAIIGATLRAALLPRAHLVLENIALRQQVAVLAHERPRPRLSVADRAFWIVLRRVWSAWSEHLVIVKPGTVVRWHRAGFRLFWAWKSRRPSGRPRVDREVRDLIRKMVRENGWGAPRIHGELQKLGFHVSERTVSRYLPRRPADPDKKQRWLTFLRNHANASAAMDFFVVPTATFRLLYGFFVIGHGRRRIFHFNATLHPTAAWVVQQLREAFPEDTAPKYLLFDRDTIFSAGVVAFVKAMGTEPVRSAYRSPWHVADRRASAAATAVASQPPAHSSSPGRDQPMTHGHPASPGSPCPRSARIELWRGTARSCGRWARRRAWQEACRRIWAFNVTL